MPLTIKDIAALMEAVRQAGYRQVRVRGEDLLFELDTAASPIDVPPEPEIEGDARAAASPADPVALPAREGLVAIAAPMTGTFYRAPEPGAPPFIEAGDRVAASDIVCIIEVMKLFSSIRAGIAGEVVEICAANETLVAAGDAVIWIKPDTVGD